MRKRVLAILMALVALCAFAVAEETAEDWVKKGDKTLVGESPEEMWNRTYGGTDIDSAQKIQVIKDGGYIIVGMTESYGAGDGDAWLIKADSEGNEEWNKTFGGPRDENGQSVRETTDGGYIIVGTTESYGDGGGDVWLIKTDSRGDEEWNKTFGGPGSDWGSSVQGTRDGGYIIAGGTQSYGAGDVDAWLIKADSRGDEEWNKTFGGQNYDWGSSVLQAEDGGYVFAGSTESYGTGSSDLWTVKIDSKGNIEWDRIFGGLAWDYGRSIQETKDGGYIIVGDTQSYGAGTQDIWVLKVDPKGTEEFNRTFGGVGMEWGSSIQQIEDGGYIITGDTESYGALTDTLGQDKRVPGNVWLLKIDSKGDMEWNLVVGGNGTDMGHSVQQTKDGGYLIVGSTNSYGSGTSDMWLMYVNREIL